MTIAQALVDQPKVVPVPFPGLGEALVKRTYYLLFHRTLWVLVDDWYFALTTGQRAMVPTGFVTDFASVPRFLWPLGLWPTGPLLAGAVPHDFYYRHGYYLSWDGKRLHTRAGKKFADKQLRLMVEQKTGMIVPAKLAYWGLTAFGWTGWYQGLKFRADLSKLHPLGPYKDLMSKFLSEEDLEL